ncbi:hypothetical protein [Devosia sp. DBB001]|nr:hypothetical protein GHV40_20665 [Devosia sp. D6-9]CDP53309.1 hypothetical protein [Devosia sp. DBB001]
MRWLSLVPIALLALMTGPALAAAETGKAVGVDPDAAAKGQGGDRTLLVGSDVAVGETVITDRRGQVQILFEDQTRLVVGPSSSLLIEKYLLRGDQTAGKFAITALSGTFRFVTGKSPKAAYEIKTPTATIGVRGTAFDFTVDQMNLTTLVLFHGSVLICTSGGACTTLNTRCQVGAADLMQSVAIRPLASLRSQFPYIRSQNGLMSAFRVDQATSCLPISSEPPEAVGGGSNNETDATPTPTPNTNTNNTNNTPPSPNNPITGGPPGSTP